MKITFRIHYNTSWGERLAVKTKFITSPKNASNNQKNKTTSPPIFMTHQGNGTWELTLDTKTKNTALSYRYWVLDDNKVVLNKEFGEDRIVDLSSEQSVAIKLLDFWRSDKEDSNSLYTSAFVDAIFKPTIFEAIKTKPSKDKGLIQFKIYAPRVKSNERIVISGNIPTLGNWDLNNPLLLENTNFPLWTSPTIEADTNFDIQYKFGIYNTLEKRISYLESGENRILKAFNVPQNNQKVIQTDLHFNYPQKEWKGTGVAVPVFSLRTEKGLGVGEFTDIPQLVDWAKENSLKMVQILPVNDTNATKTWTDSYPYAAISVFALHPIYLNLEAVEGFKEAVNIKEYKKEQKKLNALSVVDYEAVMNCKLPWAKAIFEKKKASFLKQTSFKKFMQENEHWVKPYAVFCYLRDIHGTPDFSKDAIYQVSKSTPKAKITNKKDTKTSSDTLSDAINRVSMEYFDEISFWYFIQFHLDKQLSEAGQYARDNGIILKGDIPIGIYRHSVDAWIAPELYNMDGQSGAPPDPFSESGQNWGFPTYNWEEMAKDGYQWWKNRFKQLSRYFDSFRIDHILGFFRIWQIPLEHVEGILGFFNPALSIPLQEFEERQIGFNYERLCTPFIETKFIKEVFGEEADLVINTFLERDKNGKVCFKPEFDTQRKIEAHFNKKENKSNSRWQKGLFKLNSNVLFFEVPNSKKTQFHPRIDFLSTNSFLQLEEDVRQGLEALYNDYFYTRQEDFWKQSAMTKLPAIREATNMLICGEDLGMVPNCVPGVMEDLKILTLEIQRMSKNPATEFLQENDIPYLSVASPSTHDMSPIRLWWEEMEADQRNRFFQQELNGYGEAPSHCSGEIVRRILQQHLNWRSMWVVFPLQEILAIDENIRRKDPKDERINIPANPKHYWQFRFHLSLEGLMDADEMNQELKRMILVSGR